MNTHREEKINTASQTDSIILHLFLKILALLSIQITQAKASATTVKYPTTKVVSKPVENNIQHISRLCRRYPIHASMM